MVRSTVGVGPLRVDNSVAETPVPQLPSPGQIIINQPATTEQIMDYYYNHSIDYQIAQAQQERDRELQEWRDNRPKRKLNKWEDIDSTDLVLDVFSLVADGVTLYLLIQTGAVPSGTFASFCAAVEVVSAGEAISDVFLEDDWGDLFEMGIVEFVGYTAPKLIESGNGRIVPIVGIYFSLKNLDENLFYIE